MFLTAIDSNTYEEIKQQIRMIHDILETQKPQHKRYCITLHTIGPVAQPGEGRRPPEPEDP
ncbi:MAG: hypothetical protein QXK25_05830, partial [Ignisphaera sp.]